MNTTVRSNGSLINRRPFKVLVCLVTLVAFLFNTISYDLVWAVDKPAGPSDGGPGRIGGSSLTKELRVDTFTLPEYLGRVNAKGLSPDSNLTEIGTVPALASPIVIHIQDAHCNYACQTQIAKIVEYINREYGVNTINLEGGAKDYDLSIFTEIKDRSLRNKASDYFVKEGLVNGAELFAINNPEKVNLWGVEDAKLYVENLAVYRNSLAHKGEIDKDFQSLGRALSELKIKIYSKDLLDFDMKYGAYKAGNMEFKEYLLYLIETSRTKKIDTINLANIYLLSQSLKQETNIDFKQANKEREDLIDNLQKKLSKNALEDLVLKTVEFKQEYISQTDFYEYLSAEAKQFGVNISAFPEFLKYSAYISTYDSIDKSKVIDEMEHLEESVRSALCQSDEERQLSLLSKNFILLKNMFNISLTKDDYRYYLANKDSFNASHFIDAIKGLSPDSSRSEVGTVPDADISNLDRYRDEISKFYDYSLKRDEAFVKNIKGLSPDGSNRAAILITGGFHTENLGELFKKQGVSYISIMPNFKNQNGYACPYFKILSGENNMRIVDAMPAVLKNVLATPDQLNPAIMDAMRAFLSSAQTSTLAYFEHFLKTTPLQRQLTEVRRDSIPHFIWGPGDKYNRLDHVRNVAMALDSIASKNWEEFRKNPYLAPGFDIDEGKFKEICSIYDSITPHHQNLLKIAGALHDYARFFDVEDHYVEGARMVEDILRSQKYSEDDIGFIKFLIRYHGETSTIDIRDLNNFHESTELLKALTVLKIADVASSGDRSLDRVRVNKILGITKSDQYPSGGRWSWLTNGLMSLGLSGIGLELAQVGIEQALWLIAGLSALTAGMSLVTAIITIFVTAIFAWLHYYNLNPGVSPDKFDIAIVAQMNIISILLIPQTGGLSLIFGAIAHLIWNLPSGKRVTDVIIELRDEDGLRAVSKETEYRQSDRKNAQTSQRERGIFDEAFESGNALSRELLNRRLSMLRNNLGRSTLIDEDFKVSKLTNYKIGGKEAYLVQVVSGMQPINLIVVFDKTGSYKVYLGDPESVSSSVALYRAMKNKESAPNEDGEDYVEINMNNSSEENREFLKDLMKNIDLVLVSHQNVTGNDDAGPTKERKGWEVLTAPTGSTILRALVRLMQKRPETRAAVRNLLNYPGAKGFRLMGSVLRLKARGVEGGHYKPGNNSIVMLVRGRDVSAGTFVHELTHHIFNNLDQERRQKVIDYFGNRFGSAAAILEYGYGYHALNAISGVIPNGLIDEILAYTLQALITNDKQAVSFTITRSDLEFLIGIGILPEGFKSDVVVEDNEYTEMQIVRFIKIAMMESERYIQQMPSESADSEETEASGWLKGLMKGIEKSSRGMGDKEVTDHGKHAGTGSESLNKSHGRIANIMDLIGGSRIFYNDENIVLRLPDNIIGNNISIQTFRKLSLPITLWYLLRSFVITLFRQLAAPSLSLREKFDSILKLPGLLINILKLMFVDNKYNAPTGKEDNISNRGGRWPWLTSALEALGLKNAWLDAAQVAVEQAFWVSGIFMAKDLSVMPYMMALAVVAGAFYMLHYLPAWSGRSPPREDVLKITIANIAASAAIYLAPQYLLPFSIAAYAIHLMFNTTHPIIKDAEEAPASGYNDNDILDILDYNLTIGDLDLFTGSISGAGTLRPITFRRMIEMLNSKIDSPDAGDIHLREEIRDAIDRVIFKFKAQVGTHAGRAGFMTRTLSELYKYAGMDYDEDEIYALRELFTTSIILEQLFLGTGRLYSWDQVTLVRLEKRASERPVVFEGKVSVGLKAEEDFEFFIRIEEDAYGQVWISSEGYLERTASAAPATRPDALSNLPQMGKEAMARVEIYGRNRNLLTWDRRRGTELGIQELKEADDTRRNAPVNALKDLSRMNRSPVAAGTMPYFMPQGAEIIDQMAEETAIGGLRLFTFDRLSGDILGYVPDNIPDVIAMLHDAVPEAGEESYIKNILVFHEVGEWMQLHGSMVLELTKNQAGDNVLRVTIGGNKKFEVTIPGSISEDLRKEDAASADKGEKWRDIAQLRDDPHSKIRILQRMIFRHLDSDATAWIRARIAKESALKRGKPIHRAIDSYVRMFRAGLRAAGERVGDLARGVPGQGMKEAMAIRSSQDIGRNVRDILNMAFTGNDEERGRVCTLLAGAYVSLASDAGKRADRAEFVHAFTDLLKNKMEGDRLKAAKVLVRYLHSMSSVGAPEYRDEFVGILNGRDIMIPLAASLTDAAILGEATLAEAKDINNFITLASAPPKDLQEWKPFVPGDVLVTLDGTYRVTNVLGAGGMSVICEAEDGEGRKVVIKELNWRKTGRGGIQEGRALFFREIAMLSKLKGDAAIKLLDNGQKNGIPFMVLSRASGENLFDFIQHHNISVDDALRITSLVLEAMDEVHSAGITHLDIKPENINVEADANGNVTGVTILDFGLAHHRELDSVSALGVRSSIGTIPYADPFSFGRPTPRADMYAVGIMLLKMLFKNAEQSAYGASGRDAFIEFKKELELADTYDKLRAFMAGRFYGMTTENMERLREVILKATDSDLDRRYEDVRELKAELEGVGRPAGAPSPIGIRGGRWPWLAQLLGEKYAFLQVPIEQTLWAAAYIAAATPSMHWMAGVAAPAVTVLFVAWHYFNPDMTRAPPGSVNLNDVIIITSANILPLVAASLVPSLSTPFFLAASWISATLAHFAINRRGDKLRRGELPTAPPIKIRHSLVALALIALLNSLTQGDSGARSPVPVAPQHGHVSAVVTTPENTVSNVRKSIADESLYAKLLNFEGVDKDVNGPVIEERRRRLIEVVYRMLSDNGLITDTDGVVQDYFDPSKTNVLAWKLTSLPDSKKNIDAMVDAINAIARSHGFGEDLFDSKYLSGVSRDAGVPAAEIVSTLLLESSLTPPETSDMGAEGLVQVLPATAKIVLSKMSDEVKERYGLTSYDSANPKHSIIIAAYYHRILYDVLKEACDDVLGPDKVTSDDLHALGHLAYLIGETDIKETLINHYNRDSKFDLNEFLGTYYPSNRYYPDSAVQIREFIGKLLKPPATLKAPGAGLIGKKKPTAIVKNEEAKEFTITATDLDETPLSKSQSVTVGYRELNSDERARILAMIEAHYRPKLSEISDTAAKVHIENILKHLRDNMDNVYLVDYSDLVQGYGDSQYILLNEDLFNHTLDPDQETRDAVFALLFHEAGHSYFDAYPGDPVPEGLNAHIYLRGLGIRVREETRDQTGAEKLLPQGLGLQDMLFGSHVNDVATDMIKELKVHHKASLVDRLIDKVNSLKESYGPGEKDSQLRRMLYEEICWYYGIDPTDSSLISKDYDIRKPLHNLLVLDDKGAHAAIKGHAESVVSALNAKKGRIGILNGALYVLEGTAQELDNRPKDPQEENSLSMIRAVVDDFNNKIEIVNKIIADRVAEANLASADEIDSMTGLLHIGQFDNPEFLGGPLLVQLTEINNGKPLPSINVRGEVLRVNGRPQITTDAAVKLEAMSGIPDSDYVYATVIDRVIGNDDKLKKYIYRIIVATKSAMKKKDLLKTTTNIDIFSAVGMDNGILFYREFSVDVSGAERKVSLDRIAKAADIKGVEPVRVFYNNFVNFLVENFAGCEVSAVIVNQRALDLFRESFEDVDKRLEEITPGQIDEDFVLANGSIPLAKEATTKPDLVAIRKDAQFDLGDGINIVMQDGQEGSNLKLYKIFRDGEESGTMRFGMDEDAITVSSIEITPQRRGLGIADSIVKFSASFAKQNNISKINILFIKNPVIMKICKKYYPEALFKGDIYENNNPEPRYYEKPLKDITDDYIETAINSGHFIHDGAIVIDIVALTATMSYSETYGDSLEAKMNLLSEIAVSLTVLTPPAAMSILPDESDSETTKALAELEGLGITRENIGKIDFKDTDAVSKFADRYLQDRDGKMPRAEKDGLVEKIKFLLNKLIGRSQEFRVTVTVHDEGDNKPHSVYVVTLDGTEHILNVGDTGTFSANVPFVGLASPVKVEIARREAASSGRMALIDVMKQRATGPEAILQIISEIEKLPTDERAEREMALRAAVLAKGIGDLPKNGHINIVVQIAKLGESNLARKPIQDITRTLANYPYNLFAKSMIEEGVDNEADLDALLDRIASSVKDPINANPRALLLLPEHLHDLMDHAKNYLMKNHQIDVAKPDALIKIQRVEQGDDPDLVTQFGLGFEIIEHVRKGEDAEPSQGLINLIAAMVDGSSDPKAILKELFVGVIKIRKIDWKLVDERRRAWEAVATAL